MTTAMQESVAGAIKSIKKSSYKGTALKVELEANLNRGDSGERTCEPCQGNGYTYCQDCNEVKKLTKCAGCKGSGQLATGVTKLTRGLRKDLPQQLFKDCSDCHGTGHKICETCGGDGRITCATCSGEGSLNFRSYDESDCGEFIEAHVSKEAKKALVYSEFYNDGSVDSEYTFTVMLEDAWVVPEFIKAFKELSKAVGGGCDTSGAGMHISVLNSRRGGYPGGNTVRSSYLTNFREAMIPLMFALYFLSSCDHHSRGLNYRGPQVSSGTKYSAIYCSSGIEFRCFETCYDRPEAFFDYLCVIAKCLQFYGPKKELPPFAGKIGQLGLKDGKGVNRFFFTAKHLQALREGLKTIKPDHKSIKTLYKERNFSVSIDKIKKDEAKLLAQWRTEWKEYKERRSETLKDVVQEAEKEYDYLVQSHSAEHVKSHHGEKDSYVKKQVEYFNNDSPPNQREYVEKKRQDRATSNVMAVLAV